MKFVFKCLLIPLMASMGYTNLENTDVTTITHLNLTTTADTIDNVFERYKGEWIMKGGIFETHFEGKYLKNIDSSRLLIARCPSNYSMIWDCNLGSSKVVILWTFNNSTKVVYHLSASSNGPMAQGMGTINSNGDVTLKLFHEGQCETCYRMYRYKFISADEIIFRATFYIDDKETGDYYGATLIRSNIK
jgi:hypothetical protein